MNDPNVKIYIAMHKPDDRVLKIFPSYYIPIHCGKDIYKKEEYNDEIEFLPELGDNTGDNISKLNPYYCELTAMYWIWKNNKDNLDDIVGLNHYRRYFSNGEKDREIKVRNNIKYITPLKKEKIIEILNDYNFITHGGGDLDDKFYQEYFSDYEKRSAKYKIEKFSVYDGYKHGHIIEDLNNALVIIKKLYPDLYPLMEFEIKTNGAMCLCNLVITKKKYFNEYCEFLFPVLSYVYDHINFNDNKHKDYQARALGFLSERLFRPWLIATKHTSKEVPVIKLIEE